MALVAAGRTGGPMKTSLPRRTGAAAAEIEGSCPMRGAQPRNREERQGKLPERKSSRHRRRRRSTALVKTPRAKKPPPSSSRRRRRRRRSAALVRVSVDAGGGRELPEEGRAAEELGRTARKTRRLIIIVIVVSQARRSCGYPSMRAAAQNCYRGGGRGVGDTGTAGGDLPVEGGRGIIVWRGSCYAENIFLFSRHNGNSEKREVVEGRFALLAGGQICPSSSRQNNSLTKKRRADLPEGRKK